MADRLTDATYLVGVVERMADAQHGVAVKDRTFRLKTYRACFVACEAVTWLLEHELRPSTSAPTRRAAVALGTALVKHNLIHHVVHEHQLRRALRAGAQCDALTRSALTRGTAN